MKRALFVNPFGIGDMLFTFHVLAALKKQRPDIQIDFLANERTSELARMNPDLERVHEFDRDRLRASRARNPLAFADRYRRLIADWRTRRYEALFDYSLGREFSFLGFLAGIPHRYGFDYKNRGFFLNHRLPFDGYRHEPVTRTQLRVLELAGHTLSVGSPKIEWNIPGDRTARSEVLLKDARVKDWIALAPGGGQSWGAQAIFKQWDPEKFIETANGWAVKRGGGVVLLGDHSERDLLERVRAGLRAPYAMVCGEPFGTVLALLKRCRLLLCNDGGLMHIANSLGVRTASIFGPVNEIVYGPSGEGAPHAVLTQPVSCRPCYDRFHFPPCPHDRRCLKELSVQKVLESVEKLA